MTKPNEADVAQASKAVAEITKSKGLKPLREEFVDDAVKDLAPYFAAHREQAVREAVGWRPIDEDTPDHRETVIIWCKTQINPNAPGPYSGPIVATREIGWGWIPVGSHLGISPEYHPTHWMPLPTPPTKESDHDN